VSRVEQMEAVRALLFAMPADGRGKARQMVCQPCRGRVFRLAGSAMVQGAWLPRRMHSAGRF